MDKAEARLTLKPKGKYKRLSTEQLRELEELFFMDGVTVSGASRLTGLGLNTVRKYFDLWADRLVEDDEYESWADKQKRVKARAIEGITKQYLAVALRIDHLEKLYKTVILKTIKKGRKTEVVPRTVEEIDHVLQERYEVQIRKNIELLEGLRAEMLTLNLMPPAEAILERELEKEIEAKQSSYGETVQSQ